MFLWSFERGLQQKQSSLFYCTSYLIFLQQRLPTSSLLLSKSSCDFPGLSTSPSWGLNLLLVTFFLAQYLLQCPNTSCSLQKGWPGRVQSWWCMHLWAWHGWGRLTIAFCFCIHDFQVTTVSVSCLDITLFWVCCASKSLSTQRLWF